jgi:hypothetical protein
MKNHRARYSPDWYPYPGPLTTIGKREARLGFSVVMNEVDVRIDRFCNFLNSVTGSRISQTSSVSDLGPVPGLIASIGDKTYMSSDKYEDLLLQIPDEIRSVVIDKVHNWTPNDEACALCFDGGLLWGEAFRKKYTGTSWNLSRGSKFSPDRNYPVVVGRHEWREFNPIRELLNMVIALMAKQDELWSIEAMSLTRARMLQVDSEVGA